MVAVRLVQTDVRRLAYQHPHEGLSVERERWSDQVQEKMAVELGTKPQNSNQNSVIGDVSELSHEYRTGYE